MRKQLRLSGSGGQGVITAAIILAAAAVDEGKEAVQSQSYGPEARGGASKSEVIIDDAPMLDLPYSEDSRAQVDLNCMMTEQGQLIEIQGTGEGRPFTVAEQQALVALCAKGCGELLAKQKEILGEIL